jgi:hypothetical protein
LIAVIIVIVAVISRTMPPGRVAVVVITIVFIPVLVYNATISTVVARTIGT